MKAKRLRRGDCIGLVVPSHVGMRERYAPIIATLEGLGFRVKTGENLYKDTYGYLATEQERADDFNAMALDDDVRMVFFGGGEGGNEVLPLLDFAAIADHPKLYCSYSDGTSILSAIYAQTGLVTHYGQAPGNYADLRHYDYLRFASHFIDGGAADHVRSGSWRTLRGGVCEGTLLGGYLGNFALSLGNRYYPYDMTKPYLLFLESHERFCDVGAVSAQLSHIEQSGLIGNVTGLLFGHYAETVPDDLLNRLARFGERYRVPVAYCDDFGHGVHHAVLPIGGEARMDADAQTLEFFAE